MTQKEAKQILLRAFAVTTKRHLANWQYHLDKRTPVLCGEDASYYSLRGGG